MSRLVPTFGQIAQPHLGTFQARLLHLTGQQAARAVGFCKVGEHGIDWSLGAAISEASSLRAKEA